MTSMRSKQSKAKSAQSGYSLLEVLVTLAILAIFSATAIPSMSNLIASGRQTSGTTELLIALNLARSEALKQHRHVTVCKSANGSSCGGTGVTWHDGWIVFANSSSLNVDQRQSGEVLLHVSPNMGGDAVIETNTAVDNLVSFRPNGRSAASGLFTWCDSRGAAKARGLILLPSGHAQVSRTQVDGSDLTCSGGG